MSSSLEDLEKVIKMEMSGTKALYLALQSSINAI